MVKFEGLRKLFEPTLYTYLKMFLLYEILVIAHCSLEVKRNFVLLGNQIIYKRMFLQ